MSVVFDRDSMVTLTAAAPVKRGRVLKLREDEIASLTLARAKDARAYVRKISALLDARIAGLEGVDASDHHRPDDADVRLRAQRVRGAIHGQREDADLRGRVESAKTALNVGGQDPALAERVTAAKAALGK